LILQDTGQDKGHYLRIGYFIAPGKVPELPYRGLLPERQQELLDSEYSEVFIDAEGETQRVIDIV